MLTVDAIFLCILWFVLPYSVINVMIIGIRVLRTNRTLTVLVSLQPINTKYSRDADWSRA